MGRIKYHLLIIFAAVLVISCSPRQEPVEAPIIMVIPEPEPTPAPAIVEAPPPEPIPAPIPEPIPEPPRQVVVAPPQEIRVETVGPGIITEEHYVSTRAEVQLFIQRLNQVIRSGDYEGWRAALSPELLAEISSPENLRQVSEQPIMRNRRIVLRNSQDYFTHVVQPARANITDAVDDIDIEFVTLTRVKAFTVTTSRSGDEQQVILYDLEKIGNTWTIIN